MPTTRTRPRHPSRGSLDISQVFSALERLVEQQVNHVQIITKQEQHLSALRKHKEIQLLLDPKHTQFQDSRERKREIRGQWHNEILKWDPLDNWTPDDNRSLYDILSVEQLWTTWQYKAAYPNTAKFLAKATSSEKSRSLVYYDSFFPTGELVQQWSSETPYAEERERKRTMPKRMWDIVKQRMVVHRPKESGRVRERLPSRLLRIMDISPVVAAILLASSPKSVVSNISPFLERYLTFSNFGKASMQSIRSETMNSFIFEYHFAFYYVTKDPLETHLAYTDVRKLRKFSWFGERPDNDTCGRHIYEEQMSFILTGHGHDIYTCYQLGEKYFNGPKLGDLRTFVSSPTWTPSTMFLSWIAMALHHVGIRWQNAIAAVDAQIASEEAVVFHQIDNFDLSSGAKDLKIEKLRTYFWALEAYKLFEETLETTVKAWEQFKQHSLDKVNDDRNSEDYSKSVELIELAISRLRDKIEWIQKKSKQLLRLRDGLFYVTSLSDTSVTIGQGDNIRLLTYFTILFLPLSFSTSIFGMQSNLPRATSMKTFSIVLPVVTVTTVLAVLVLTGALQDMQKTITENIPNPEQKLRELMLEHPPQRWRKEPFHASGVPGEQLSPWTYLVFLADLCFISIPVHEVKEAVGLYGLRNRHPAPSNRSGSSISQQHLNSSTTLVSSHRPDTGETNARSRARLVIDLQLAERQSSRKGLILVTVQQARSTLFISVRILLVCVWVPLLLLEYVALLFCCPFMTPARAPTQANSQRRISKRERLKHFFTAPFVFLDLDLSQSHTRRRRTEHEHRSPVPPAEPFDHALSSFPQPYFYASPAAGDQPPGPGREPHMRGAQRRIRHVMAQPTFQAAWQHQRPSGPSPGAAQPQLENPPPSVYLRPHGYSDVEGGIPRQAGGVWRENSRSRSVDGRSTSSNLDELGGGAL